MGATHIASDGDLEQKVFKILERVGCPVERNNIEACHRISQKKKKNVLNAKKELRKLDMKETCFPDNNLIFVNQSLCRYYRVLCS